MITIGILAIQGDVAEHKELLHSLGCKTQEIRTLHDLDGVTHLIIPGGESTVISRFLESENLSKSIFEKVRRGALAVYGTCAGAILVATRVHGKNSPRPLGLIDITIERNAYGAQLDSFETELNVKGVRKPVPVSFIRAPIIRAVGTGVEILASHANVPVLVRQKRVLAGTFHPELRGSTAIHQMLLNM